MLHKDLYSRQDRLTLSFIEGARSSSIDQGAYHVVPRQRSLQGALQTLAAFYSIATSPVGRYSSASGCGRVHWPLAAAISCGGEAAL